LLKTIGSGLLYHAKWDSLWYISFV